MVIDHLNDPREAAVLGLVNRKHKPELLIEPDRSLALAVTRQHKDQNENCAANADSFCEVATAYALTGDAKYGEFCRRMFLAYAENHPRWGRQPNASWRSAREGRFSFQFLNDGMLLGWPKVTSIV